MTVEHGIDRSGGSAAAAAAAAAAAGGTATPAGAVISVPSGGVTDNAVIRWDGTTGLLVQNSTAILEDDGRLTVTYLTVTNDGAGSNIDADQLDGLEGAVYALVDGTRPFTGRIRMTEVSAPGTADANQGWLYSFDRLGKTVLGFITDDGISMELAQDNYFLARNATGGTLTKGTPLYVSGVQGNNRPQVAKAKADSASTLPVIGFAGEDIANNSDGRVMFSGVMENVDTSAFIEGDILFLSATTAGVLTATQPSHPNFSVRVANVLTAHATQGRLLIGQFVIKRNQDGTNDDTWAIGSSATDRAVLSVSGSTLTASRTFTFADADTLITDDHGSLQGLTDDDHTQYVLLAGRSGGQQVYGGTAAGNDLTLTATSHATPGDIIFETDDAYQAMRIFAAGYVTVGAAAFTPASTYQNAGDFSVENDAYVGGNAEINGNVEINGNSFGMSGAAAGGNLAAAFANTSTGGTDGMRLNLRTANDTSGDPFIVFDDVANTWDWSLGIDNSDSNKFKIGYSAHPTLGAPGVGEVFSITTGGAVKFANAYTFPTADGTANQVLQTNGSGTLTFATASGGGGSGASSDFQQSAHGFAVGDIVRLSNSAYVKAKADSAANAEVAGIIGTVTNASNATIVYIGAITGMSGLTAGTTYFLSAATAGALTATEPSTVGQISKPCFLARTTSGGIFVNMRGAVVGNATSSLAQSIQSGNGSTTAFTLPATPVDENNVLVFISGVWQQRDTYSVSGATLTFSAAPPTGTNNIEFIVVGSVAIGTATATDPGATLTLGTEQASTSGTSIDFTGIPAGTKQIIIQFVGVSTNGTSVMRIQLGDSGGVEVTGYAGSCTLLQNAAAVSTIAFTAGFDLISGTAARVYQGAVTLTLEDASDNTWALTGQLGRTDTATNELIAGTKALSAVLDRVRITTANGTDAFDAGSINIAYK